MTEVVDNASPEERRFKATTASRWGAGLASCRRNPSAEGGVQPLDIGSVENPDANLGDRNQLFSRVLCPMKQTAFDCCDTTTTVAFDDLDNVQIRPELQTRSPWIPCVNRSPED